MSILSLRRYPVKSMAGEELDSVDATANGLLGDRAYALVDIASGKVGSAKSVRKFGDLLRWRAEFSAQPRPQGAIPPVRITSPDGDSFASIDAHAAKALSDAFGPKVSLRSVVPDGLLLEFAAGTLAGAHAQTTEVPIGGAAPGTFFDFAAIHIVTTATLRRLQESHPAGAIAVDRFRPNIVIDCAQETGLIENDWVGRSLRIGAEAVVRVSIPCPRCVMTTLPRPDLPSDTGILRTLANLNMVDLGEIGRLPCAGIYADVVTPGHIRVGDPVRFVD